MRTIIFMTAFVTFAAPAFAPALAQEPSDTLRAVIANGQSMSGSMQGMDLHFTTTYSADGGYTTVLEELDRTMKGAWRIDGDKLCTKGASGGPEDCAVYPSGKGPGDTFDIDHPRMGAATVTINKGEDQ